MGGNNWVSPFEFPENAQVAPKGCDQVVSILPAHEPVFVSTFNPHKALFILRQVHMRVISRKGPEAVTTPCFPTWCPTSSVAIEVHTKDCLEAHSSQLPFHSQKFWGIFELPRPGVIDKRQENSNRQRLVRRHRPQFGSNGSQIENLPHDTSHVAILVPSSVDKQTHGKGGVASVLLFAIHRLKHLPLPGLVPKGRIDGHSPSASK
jgi:hypothetical protein